MKGRDEVRPVDVREQRLLGERRGQRHRQRRRLLAELPARAQRRAAEPPRVEALDIGRVALLERLERGRRVRVRVDIAPLDREVLVVERVRQLMREIPLRDVRRKSLLLECAECLLALFRREEPVCQRLDVHVRT